MNRLAVYVPFPETSAWGTIAPGSGVVGQPAGTGRVLVYFEGNLYGVAHLQTFTERVRCAAWRFVQSYPTVGRLLAPEKEFLQIGVYDYESKALTIEDDETLAVWLADAESRL